MVPAPGRVASSWLILPVLYTKRLPLCVTARTAPGAAPAATAESRNCITGCQLTFSAGTGVGGAEGWPGAQPGARIAKVPQPGVTAPAAGDPSRAGIPAEW